MDLLFFSFSKFHLCDKRETIHICKQTNKQFCIFTFFEISLPSLFIKKQTTDSYFNYYPKFYQYWNFVLKNKVDLSERERERKNVKK